MFTVFKITEYPYCVKVSVHATKSEATAEAEWQEEQGNGKFIVRETN